jgi:hypothetical protein
MNLSKKYFWIYAIAMVSASCVRSIELPIRTVTPILVVEGGITNEAPPYTINLSYSGKFENVYEDSASRFVTDAQVSIKDDTGDSVACTWVGLGTYQTSDSNFKGIVGRTYTLTVRLSSGKTYVSTPEKIQPVPPIDSLSVFYDNTIGDVRPTQFIISANTSDPAGVKNYYRWKAYGYIPRKSIGDGCEPLGAPPAACHPYLCTCHALCEQLLRDDRINVLSDRYVDGREIKQTVFYSPVYWHGKHFIEIRQESVNQDIYQYWVKYQEQTNRTGSILDPLPSSLIGNIHNAADSTDLGLGIFSASAVYTKRIILLPFFLQDYLLLSVATTYMLPGDCSFVFPDALPDNSEPPGWETAQLIELH